MQRNEEARRGMGMGPGNNPSVLFATFDPSCADSPDIGEMSIDVGFAAAATILHHDAGE